MGRLEATRLFPDGENDDRVAPWGDPASLCELCRDKWDGRRLIVPAQWAVPQLREGRVALWRGIMIVLLSCPYFFVYLVTSRGGRRRKRSEKMLSFRPMSYLILLKVLRVVLPLARSVTSASVMVG